MHTKLHLEPLYLQLRLQYMPKSSQTYIFGMQRFVMLAAKFARVCKKKQVMAATQARKASVRDIKLNGKQEIRVVNGVHSGEVEI
jgi:hypothetical protein